MNITCTLQKLKVIVCSGGRYRQLIFNPMPEERARELVREYGFRPEDVRALLPLDFPYRSSLDELDVLDWLDRRHTYRQLSVKDLYIVVREHVPNLLRIHGSRAFIAAYGQIVFQGNNPFLLPMADLVQDPEGDERPKIKKKNQNK